MSLPEQLLDDEALGQLLGGKSPAAIRQLRHRSPNALPPAIRVGGRIMYDPRDIEAWLIEQKEERTAGAALSSSQHSQKSAP